MIAIIDYGAGNVRSVQNALNRLGHESKLTSDRGELLAADRVILPGVGDAGWAMNALRERELDVLIPSLTQPVLGICLGLQLMSASSEESQTECLGIFDTKVKRFPPQGIVPQMGWNDLSELKGPLFNSLGESDDMYFVHSYYAECCEETLAVCDYILPFSAALGRDNFYATQFHPEKSSEAGSKLLQNFLSL